MLLRFLLIVAFVALTAGAVRSQQVFSELRIGVGPHGYDWLIGTWSCVDNMPSLTADPNAKSRVTVAKNAVGDALIGRESAKDFDSVFYSAYNTKTKTWWNPVAFADGSSQNESTNGTGKTETWNGSYFNAKSGTTTRIRDVFTNSPPAEFTDLGQSWLAGTWKTVYFITCKKTLRHDVR